MKTKNMIWAALSMTAALVMTACTNDDNAVETPAAPQAEVKTIPYTVTVSQGGDATTRATVDSDNKTLYFADGDKLYVTGTNISGTLDIQTGTGTASATFSGDLTYTGEGTPASDLSLTATLVSAQQTDGTEVTINPTTKAVTVNYPTAAYCDDVATAVQKYSNLTVTSTYGSKSFTLTQQTAFLNFEITFADGTAENTTLETVVNNNSTDICTANVKTRTEGGKVVAKFVLPVIAGTTLIGATVKMGDKPALTIKDATLDGKVYNVKRTVKTTDLSTISSDYTAQNGETLTGELTNKVKISIADGAIVTLKDVTINGTNNSSYKFAGITCVGSATIILEGVNTVKGFYENYPGIYVPENKTLTIQGTGSLTASSNGYGAGIGGGYWIDCGNIVISDGTITATGGSIAAGIGGGNGGTCGNIVISGGTITATGGEDAAGIGSGNSGIFGAITISGGTVTATGVNCAAGIGGGYENGTSGTITITNGATKVEATGGNYAPCSIGKGYDGTAISVTIDGTVYPDGISVSPYTYEP